MSFITNRKNVNFIHQALANHLNGMMTCANRYIDYEKVNDSMIWVLEIFVTKHYLSKLLNFKGVRLLWKQNSPTNKLI
ncbi:hypothetical protein [Candidatus Vesicomyidisocius sp. SY067_SCS001]|uniref:hypothetical protein n=1 Tax=Candidatus Vesicomyidisocius sp. SY067_SCS001 TaxID=2732590 RepID=UPI00168A0FB3|nr:hypothetical protein [Candidatus Vesicomyosocius sp. SY067_SCS001]